MDSLSIFLDINIEETHRRRNWRKNMQYRACSRVSIYHLYLSYVDYSVDQIFMLVFAYILGICFLVSICLLRSQLHPRKLYKRSRS